MFHCQTGGRRCHIWGNCAGEEEGGQEEGEENEYVAWRGMEGREARVRQKKWCQGRAIRIASRVVRSRVPHFFDRKAQLALCNCNFD